MEILSAIGEIVRDLLIFVAAMTALLIVLLVVIARLPNDNPLKRILTALSYRVGATAAAGALAIPVEPIPGLDVAYDVGVPIVLILYWLSFSGIWAAGRKARCPRRGRRCSSEGAAAHRQIKRLLVLAASGGYHIASVRNPMLRLIRV